MAYLKVATQERENDGSTHVVASTRSGIQAIGSTEDEAIDSLLRLTRNKNVDEMNQGQRLPEWDERTVFVPQS